MTRRTSSSVATRCPGSSATLSANTRYATSFEFFRIATGSPLAASGTFRGSRSLVMVAMSRVSRRVKATLLGWALR